MNEVAGTEIYRVCAVSTGRWDVYQESLSRPVASFSDKASALNYAMCLARGRVASHLLLRSGDRQPGAVPDLNETDGARARH
ncbi:MAG: hypothetical protein WDO56_13405 [Gammaproteobacteria bacterium]